MEKVTVFLRTALFSFGGDDAHVPTGVMVLVGEVVDRPSGGITIKTERLLGERGRLLSEAKHTLCLPWAKVDHIVAAS
jgi:hypothetical protein